MQSYHRRKVATFDEKVAAAMKDQARVMRLARGGSGGEEGEEEGNLDEEMEEENA
jgi:hypothetical protein